MTNSWGALSQLADEAMERCDDVWTEAQADLVERIQANAGVTSDAIVFAAHYLVRLSSHKRRRHIRMAKRADNLRRLGNWYDYPLQDGKHLGKATRLDLENEMAWHRILSQANAQKARWYERMIRLLPDDTTPVEAVVSQETIGKLYEEHFPVGEAA